MTDEQAPAPWLGKEMLRQVELRLQAQATALAALEGRAAGLLTLCGSGILALGATVVAAQSPAWQHGALTAVAMLLLAAIILMIWLWPQDWGVVGIDPAEMSTYGNYSENDCLEAMAGSLAGSIAPNGRRISQLSGAVKVATILVLLAGPVGLLVVKLA